MILKSKDVLGLEELSAEEILGVLEIASRFRAVFDRPGCVGGADSISGRIARTGPDLPKPLLGRRPWAH